jgi:hypothetical protein
VEKLSPKPVDSSVGKMGKGLFEPVISRPGEICRFFNQSFFCPQNSDLPGFQGICAVAREEKCAAVDISSGFLLPVHIGAKQPAKARLFGRLSTVFDCSAAQLSPKAVGRSVDKVGKGRKEPRFTGPGANRVFFNHAGFIALKQ